MSNVVVTGGTRGIGNGIAREFAVRGHNVMICGRNPETVNVAANELAGLSGEVAGQPCDVSSPAELQALWDAAALAFGTVDIWINNAGLARTVWSIVETPADEVESMLHTNMRGTIFGSTVAASGMTAQGNGKIFNVLGGGSDGEYFPGIAIYGTTKRGLDYFSRALARELKDTGVLVGRVRPGMVITEAVIREARADLESFQRSRKMMNNLVDRVETVAPFLVDEMLAFSRNGGRIRWLTGSKIGWRMLKARFSPRPDQFEDFGL